MPRQKKCRRICSVPKYGEFFTKQENCPKVIIMGIDEYETIRLIDLLKLTQEECGEQMNVARTTVTGIYESAREKLADALINGKKLVIEGGDIQICNFKEKCPNEGRGHCLKYCKKIMEDKKNENSSDV